MHERALFTLTELHIVATNRVCAAPASAKAENLRVNNGLSATHHPQAYETHIDRRAVQPDQPRHWAKEYAQYSTERSKTRRSRVLYGVAALHVTNVALAGAAAIREGDGRGSRKKSE